MKIYIKWAGREYPFIQRLLATLLAGVLIVFLIPYSLIRLGPRLDSLLGFPSISFGIVNIVLGGCLIITGLIFGLWSIISQLSNAGGTPLPLMPTQKLLINRPFNYCRNPMTFGTICIYTGVGVVVGSISAIVIVFILAALLITYLKRFEEQELAARFGQDYLNYKANTPFIIPRIFRR